MSIGIIQAALTGWNGAPGTNTFVVSRGGPELGWEDLLAQAASELSTVYEALRVYTPDGWTATFTGVARIYDEVTGDLQAVGAYAVPDPVESPATPEMGKNSRATQAVVQYRTTDINAGRLIRGRSFLGPITPSAFAEDGTIVGGLRTSVEAAYGGLLSGLGPRLAVWSRPAPGRPGAYGDVKDVEVSALPGVLRSRRD